MYKDFSFFISPLNIYMQRKSKVPGTYIPLGMGFALGSQREEICTKKMKCTWPTKLASPNARDTNMLVFLVLGDAKLLSFASGDAKVPDARYFAFWWNIGLRVVRRVRRRVVQCV